MRIRYWILLLLVIAIGGAWLGAMMNSDPGYVMFAWRETTVEMSVWVWLVLNLLLFVTIYIGIRLIFAIRAPWSWFQQWSQDSKLQRMQKETRHGLLALANGQYQRAKDKLRGLVDTTTQPLVVVPALAQAEARLGLYDIAIARLDKLSDKIPAGRVLLNINKAEIYIQQGKPASALHALQQVASIDKNHCLANEMQLELLQAMGRWLDVIALLQVIKAAKQMPPEMMAQQQQSAYRKAFAMRVKQGCGLDDLMTLWRKAPIEVLASESCQLAAAEAMVACEDKGNEHTARFVENCLSQSWNDNLVLLYSQLVYADAKDAQGALIKLESWLSRATHSAALQLALGRMCRRLELWGKAADYLAASLALQPSKEAYGELARLNQQLGQTDQALANYQLASTH